MMRGEETILGSKSFVINLLWDICLACPRKNHANQKAKYQKDKIFASGFYHWKIFSPLIKPA